MLAPLFILGITGFCSTNKYHFHTVKYMQGLSIPFACIGSGDPVRVLRLYTTSTLDIF